MTTKALIAFCTSAAVATTGIVAACGGASNGPSCGAGTVLENGTCVVPHEAAADTAPADVNEFDSSADSTARSDGYAAPPMDASVEAAEAGLPDDPCPTVGKGLFVNCANDCGGLRGCSTVKCGSGGMVLEITNENDLPLVIRTPSHPGVDPACPGDCGVPVDYAVSAIINLPSSVPYVHATMDYPSTWQMSGIAPVYCPAPPNSEGCEGLSGTSASLFMWTSDPNAPARNITVASAQTLMCLPIVDP